MRDTIKGAVIGAVVAAGVSVLLAQTPTWSTPRTWATDDLLTATEFNAQFRDNLLMAEARCPAHRHARALGSRLRHARDQ